MKNFKHLKRFVITQGFYVDGNILWSFGPDYFNLYSISLGFDSILQWDNDKRSLKLCRNSVKDIPLDPLLNIITIHNIYNVEFMVYLHKEIVRRYENTPDC